MKRVWVAVLWIAVFCIITAGIRYFDHSEKKLYQSAVVFPIMSTQASLSFTDTSEEEIEQAFRLARAEMEKVALLCNYFDPESELSKLNAEAAGKPFVCSAALWEILQETRKFHRISRGAFDPTIRPLMKVWGFHRKRKTLPEESEIVQAKKICGFELLFRGAWDAGVYGATDVGKSGNQPLAWTIAGQSCQYTKEKSPKLIVAIQNCPQ